MLNVIITTGGTGGHIFPAVSVARELKTKRPDANIVFVCPRNKRFIDILEKEKFNCEYISAMGMPRKLSARMIPFGIRLILGIIRSFSIMKKYKPDVIIGFGNFGSVAPVYAGYKKAVPALIHEANLVPGKANKFLAKYAAKIAVNFPETVSKFANPSIEIVGMPVRKEFGLPGTRKAALEYFGLQSEKFTLLITGGSRGAHYINEVICNSLDKLQKTADKIQTIHLTGDADYEWVAKKYSESRTAAYVRPFEAEMKKAYDAADLVLSRAGASALAEITATGKPSVLIPYPYATENHQQLNAEYLEQNGAAVVIENQHLTPEIFLKTVTELMNNKNRLQNMSENSKKLATHNSAEKIVDIALKLVKK